MRYDSFYKYLRALPEKLDLPSGICDQLNAESLISAELQRLYSAFLVMIDRVARDNHAVGYSSKTIFQFAKSSTMSNHFAKKIFDLCLGDTAMSRLTINIIRALSARFDEFEAVFFPRYSRIVDENPESFGFSMRVFRRYIELPLLGEAEYRALRQMGIIFDTNVILGPGEETRIMTWNEMGRDLRSFSLLSAMRDRTTIVRLPIPVAYEEELTDKLVELSPPPIEVISIDSDVLHMANR